MQQLGMPLVIIMIVGCLGVVGGLENLSPDASLGDLVTLSIGALLSLVSGVIGVGIIKENS